MNQKGIAAIEAACGVLVLSGVFALALQLFQVASARLWLNHQLYQALICAAENETRQTCERIAVRQSSISVTRDIRFSLWRTLHGWHGSYQWTGFAGAKLSGQMELALDQGRAGSPSWR